MDQDLVLRGKTVRLRPLELSDADALHEIYREPQTMRFYGKPVCDTLDKSRLLIKQMRQLEANGAGYRWAILRRQNSVVVGSIGFHGWDRNCNCAFLSYEIVPQYRGQQLSVDAGRLVIEFGITTMGLRRVLAVIDLDNAASVATATRLGFKLESAAADSRAADHLNRRTFSLSFDGEGSKSATE